MARTELAFAPHAYRAAGPYIVGRERHGGWLEARAESFLNEALQRMWLLGPELHDGDRRWVVDALGRAIAVFDPSHPDAWRRVNITAEVVQVSLTLPGAPIEELETLEMMCVEREILMALELP